MLILDGEIVQRLVLQHGQIHGIVGHRLCWIAALWRALEVNGRHMGIGQCLFMGHIPGSHSMASRIGSIDATARLGAQVLRINRRLERERLLVT